MTSEPAPSTPPAGTTPQPISGYERLVVAGAVVAFAAGLTASGWTRAAMFPDTAGYLAVAPYPDFYLQSRLPVLPAA